MEHHIGTRIEEGLDGVSLICPFLSGIGHFHVVVTRHLRRPKRWNTRYRIGCSQAADVLVCHVLQVSQNVALVHVAGHLLRILDAVEHEMGGTIAYRVGMDREPFLVGGHNQIYHLVMVIIAFHSVIA